MALDSATKQEKINEDTHKKVLNNPIVTDDWRKLLEAPAPTEKDNKRDLLLKHLNNYTTKNTADYFIHKDLGKFLNNELDFFIKNEVMHLDDVVNSDSFAQIEKQLAIVKCVRLIGRELIGFLASLEDFQKRLWLKKKFVVSSHYCVTLDRVNADLYGEIAGNAKQWEQWESLGLNVGDSDKGDWGTAEYLVSHPYLMVDTSLFEVGFKAKLLREIEDLDGQTDGVIIHSDNFQALNLIKEKYKEKIQTIYIDPPYNTGSDGFTYKDGYKSSSWLTLMDSTTQMSRDLLNPNSSFFAMNIDKRQLFDGKLLLEQDLNSMKFVNAIVNVNNPKGRSDQKHLPTAHDNIVLFATEDAISHGWLPQNKVLKRYNKSDSIGKYREIDLRKTGDNDLATDRPNMAYSFAFNEKTNVLIPIKLDESMPNDSIEIAPMKTQEIKGRWRWEYATSVEHLNRLVAKFQPKKQQWSVFEKDYLGDDERVLPTSVWDEKPFNSERGTETFINLGFAKELFPRPKPVGLILYLLEHLTNRYSFILDYFAGSGTTAHSLVNLNREYDTKRKYILVEQSNDNFNKVIKPRIQKVVYSKSWLDGKPFKEETDEEELPNDTLNRYDGISHCLKVIKLESYEDTLNNLELRRTGQQQQLFDSMNNAQKDDYLMHYLLDIESKGSLLSVADFAKPFDYQLKITSDSAGAYTTQPIDLIDTFNYLIGLNLQHIDYQLERGYVFIEGTLRTGEKTLVFWRDTSVIGYDKLEKTLLERLKVNPKDREYQLIYLNGDHNIPSPFINTDDGERKLKIRSIEQTFFDKMFEE